MQMRRYGHQALLLLAILCALLFCVSSCKQSTKPKTGIITGVIKLDEQTDHSGITVAIYPGSIVPEELSTINATYPQLAFPIQDRHIFDHREYTPLQIVQTDPDGRFETARLPFGKYIICYCKEGWGYNYAYDVNLNASQSDPTTNLSLTLYPVVYVPSGIDSDYVFKNDHCYVFSQSTIATESANLILTGSAKLLLDPGVVLSSYGTISTDDDGYTALISSTSNIYNPGMKPTSLGHSIKIYKPNTILSNLTITYLLEGMMSLADNQTYSCLSFCSNGVGFQSSQTNNSVLNNSLFHMSSSEGNSSIYLYMVNECLLQNNLFFQDEVSIRHKALSNSILTNNYFISGKVALENSFDSTCRFEHNEIADYEIGVDNTARSNVELFFNSISANVCLKNWHYPNYSNYKGNGIIIGSNNNFTGTQNSILCSAHYYGFDSTLQFDFSHNYWGVSEESEIENTIIDASSLGDPMEGYQWAVINYSNFYPATISEAGIIP